MSHAQPYSEPDMPKLSPTKAAIIAVAMAFGAFLSYSDFNIRSKEAWLRAAGVGIVAFVLLSYRPKKSDNGSSVAP